MTIVEIFIVRSRSEEENRLSEQAVVSNELVGRKLSFARSNLLGPWLNRRLPAGSGRTPLFPFSFFSSSSLSLSLSVCLSVSLSLLLTFFFFSFLSFCVFFSFLPSVSRWRSERFLREVVRSRLFLLVLSECRSRKYLDYLR